MKNINIVNKIIAKQLNKPLHLVASINSFYWKTSKKKLIDAEPTTLYWKHIGSITISKYKLYNEIHKTIDKIRSVRSSPKYNEKTRVVRLEALTARLIAMLRHRNQLALDEYNKRLSPDDEIGDEESDQDTESIHNEDI